MVALTLQMFGNGRADRSGRRAKPRTTFDGRVSYLSSNRIVMPRTGDISMAGAFVATHHPDPVGTEAAIQIEHNNEQQVVDVVVTRLSFHSNDGAHGIGMGLRFSNLSRSQRKFIASFIVARHETERGQK